MISIFATTEHIKEVIQIIQRVDRLHELVNIHLFKDQLQIKPDLLVANQEISLPLDWQDSRPPYLFPKQPLDADHLLSIVFFLLGNYQQALSYQAESHPLHQHIRKATYLQVAYPLSQKEMEDSQAENLHNFCIMAHYGQLSYDFDYAHLPKLYEQAIDNNSDLEKKTLTVKHYINFLLYTRQIERAESLLSHFLNLDLSPDARQALQVQQANLWMGKIKIPYDFQLLDRLEQLQEKCITYYEKQKQEIGAGLLLIDASEIANIRKDFPRSMEKINRAIQYFRANETTEFLGEASLRKATLLYTWSKNGSPQYYKAAINAYQDALKVFSRDEFPQKFADIHHHLGVIYSEIPVGPDEKAIWAAFCASSFKEALAFYQKENFPYEYAMVCHNYATALMGFPPAKMFNHLEKARDLFEEALLVRQASHFPFERALTLLNQLELCWLLPPESLDQLHYQTMLEKAQEIQSLVDDATILEKVEEHLEKLEALKTLI